jgi:hypothetical protein
MHSRPEFVRRARTAAGLSNMMRSTALRPVSRGSSDEPVSLSELVVGGSPPLGSVEAIANRSLVLIGKGVSRA